MQCTRSHDLLPSDVITVSRLASWDNITLDGSFTVKLLIISFHSYTIISLCISEYISTYIYSLIVLAKVSVRHHKSYAYIHNNNNVCSSGSSEKSMISNL